jgi:iron complex transport system substrate-binding protein
MNSLKSIFASFAITLRYLRLEIYRKGRKECAKEQVFSVYCTALYLVIVMVLTTASCRPATPSKNTAAKPTVLGADRDGKPVRLPTKIDKIISIAPSNTEILAALGFADKIIAADSYSLAVEGVASDILSFDSMIPDAEQIIILEPDIVFVAGISKVGGIDPFKTVSDVGICVLYIPTSTSIADIKADIRFIATVMGAVEKGEEIVAEMEKTIDSISTVGETITDKKTVYFEISAMPHLYSFGKDVFLNEMLEIIGAENILADRRQWAAVAEEVILDRNPDVIVTNVDYAAKPVAEILARPGWNVLTAVQNRDVHYIDTDTSCRPTHNIVQALKAMAKAVYPDKY